jgi:hypothetical protein
MQLFSFTARRELERTLSTSAVSEDRLVENRIIREWCSVHPHRDEDRIAVRVSRGGPHHRHGHIDRLGLLPPTPVLHDEVSYLFEAWTFAAGHPRYPTPPFPEFFEQLHVLVTPRFASRYPSGFATALIPGVWLGGPALGPVLLAGLSAACLFALAQRLSGDRQGHPEGLRAQAWTA